MKYWDTKKTIVAVLLLIGVIFTWWLSNIFDQPTTKFDGKNRHDPDYIIRNYTANRININNKTQYIMRAELLKHYPDDNTASLLKLHITQQKPNQLPVYFTADKGFLSADGKILRLQGNVKQMQGGLTAKVGSMKIRLDR